MIELFVENQKLDIDETFSTIISYAIDDVKNFGSKDTAFSKTIILPGTKYNNAFFGNVFSVTVSNAYSSTLKNYGTNFNAAISARAYITNGNIQCFKGVLRLLAINILNGIIDYEVSVVGELGGFMSNRGNKKIEELDFSAYNHVYSIANITSSWDNIAIGAGYYYPLIDYGTFSDLKHNWKFRTFRPSLFVKEYIDKMFSASGYTYDCTLFGTNKFRRLIVPHNQKALTNNKLNILNASRSVDETVISDVSSNDAALTFQTITSSIFSSTPSRLTYNGTNTINIVLSFNFTYSFKTTNNTILFALRKNGTVVASKTLPNVGGNTFTGNWIIDQPLTLAPTDYIEFYATVSNSTFGNYYNFIHKTSSISIASTSAIPVPINIGDDLKINDTIPKNILQLDFFSSVLKLFNLYVFEDAGNDKLLKIKPFVDFYTNAGIDDWTLKIDRGSNINIKPMSELNARYYEFSYKDDSDFFNEQYKKRYNLGYGSYLYDSQFEFVKETDKIELVFSPTPLVGYASEDKIYSTILKKSGAVEETIDSNIRILQAKQITGVSSYTILDDNGTTVLSTQTRYGYAGHFDNPDAPANDLNFGVLSELYYQLSSGALNVNQFNVYWSPYMAEITDKDSKLMTCKMKLGYKDIHNFDYSRLKWIDGSLFRVNRIDNFNATREDVCDVQLLKVIGINGINYGPATNNFFNYTFDFNLS